MNKISKEDLLIFYLQDNWEDLFRDHFMFLAWIEQESSYDAEAKRFEPLCKEDSREACTSWGLFQMMGYNILLIMHEEYLELLAGFKWEDFWDYLIKTPWFQSLIARKFMRKCPSRDLEENLRWWNTGKTEESKKGNEYVSRIKERRNRLLEELPVQG